MANADWNSDWVSGLSEDNYNDIDFEQTDIGGMTWEERLNWIKATYSEYYKCPSE